MKHTETSATSTRLRDQVVNLFEKGVIWLLATMFIFSGITKFAGSAALISTFANWGYPAWFAYLIGGIELAAGILLLVPHLRVFGAFILTLEMFGAFFTHFVHGEVLIAFLPLVVMGLTAWTTYLYSGEFVMNFKRLLNWSEVDARQTKQPHLFKTAQQTVRY